MLRVGRGPGRPAGPDRRAQHAVPGRDGRRRRRGRARVGGLRDVPEGEFWSGAPAQRVSGAARGPWSERPAQLARLGRRRTPPRPRCSVLLPAVAIAAGGCVGPGRRRRRRAAPAWPTLTIGAAALAGARRPWSRWLRAGRCWCSASSGWLGSGMAARRVPGPEPGRPPGVGDDAGPRRGPHLAVPALLLAADPGLAARCSAPGSASDVEASTVLMIPALTTVNDHAFLADDTLIGGYELGGGWLRIERVKIGKRAFVGNSGMAAPGRKVPKRALVAVLSAAPRRKTAKAGASWLGSPPAALRRTAEAARTSAPTPRRPGSGSPARGWEAGPARAGAGRRRPARRRRCWSRSPSSTRPSGAGWLRRWSPSGRRCWSPAALAAALATVAAKWLLVGRLRRRHPPAVELVRLAQRAGRHLRRGGRRAVVRAGRDRHAAATLVPVAGRRRSAAGSGARPTGCPRPTWSSSATAPPSTRAASCRPTCSTTGC